MTGRVSAPSHQDLAAFRQLFRAGAWTPTEATAHLGRYERFIDAGWLTELPTDMGPVVLLRHAGNVLAFGVHATTVSPSKAIDLLYLRLCLDDLGWTLLRPAHRGRASDVDRLERYHLVQTDEGEAYVLARLTAGGYSTSGMKRTVEGLYGQLLFERRKVVLLTPSGVRGRSFEERNEALFRIVQQRPRTTKQGGRRLHGGTAMGERWGVPVDSQGPLIAPGVPGAHDRLGLPDLTRDILSRVRQERVQLAHEALACDLVLSGEQLGRHYGLGPQDLHGVPFVEDLVLPIYNNPNSEQHTRFYLARKTLANHDANHLAHLAGTAEIRHQLGVKAGAWTAEFRGALVAEIPDAEWTQPDGEVIAVEYDSGAYSMDTVLRKVRSFRKREYQDIVWGTPSKTRVNRLRRDANLDALTTRWFDRS